MNTMSEIIYYKICSSIYIFFYAFFFLGGLSYSVSVSHLALEGPFRSWLVLFFRPQSTLQSLKCFNRPMFYRWLSLSLLWLPGSSVVKNLPAIQETRVRSLAGKILWRKSWQPTVILLPGESHGKRSLVGYSP